MPTYEYLCSDCGNHFEQVQKISEDALKNCPKCSKDTLRRIVNAAAFHLKGSGWYKTDYASSGSTLSQSSSVQNSSSSTNSDSTTTSKDSISASNDNKSASKKPESSSLPASSSANNSTSNKTD